MEALRTDRFRDWNGEVMAQSMERTEGVIQLLRPPDPPRGHDYPAPLRQRPPEENKRVPDGSIIRTGPVDGSGDGYGDRAAKGRFITRIIRRVRSAGDTGEPAPPTSDADFTAKIEAIAEQLTYSKAVMERTQEHTETLRRINRTGNFVETHLVPELRKDPHDE